MTKLAPEWVRTSDPVIRSPARYCWTTAPAYQKNIHRSIITQWMMLGPLTFMAKTDIEAAFRIVPIAQPYHHLLGCKWREQDNI